MKSSIRNFLALATVAIAYSTAQAQPAQAGTTLKIGVGECTTTGPKASCSTYTRMLRELRQEIGDTDLGILEQQTKGSVECGDMLIGNQVHGCFMQADVLFSRKRNEDLSGLATLLAFHTEEVHFVAPVESGLQRQGSGWKAKLSLGKMGKEGVVINLVDELDGDMLVGAVKGSGSAVTARLVAVEGGLPYKVKLYENGDALRAALDNKEVQAAVYVGGQRLPAVEAYSSQYKLLGFSKKLQDALKDVYTPSRLTYSNLSNAEGIQSVSTRAELVVYKFKTPKMVQALANFRAKALKVFPELAETTGTHAKWKEVAKLAAANGGRGKWEWYELPTATVAPAGKPAKK